MDLLHPITALPLRAVQPASASERGPRAVQATGQGFAGTFAGERQAEDAAPHGDPAKPMFFSLLSEGTLGVLRQMVFRGLSYRIDDSGTGPGGAVGGKAAKDAPSGAPGGSPQAATVTEGFSFNFNFTVDGAATGSAFQGMMRRATAAYTQAFAASPAFPFARPAETLNMVA